MLPTDLSKPRRIELILRQIESLPTLPTVATRLLQLTSSSEAEVREIVELVSSDPPLTAKVLSLCRSADRGIRNDIVTVDRAVVLLGFNAIRNAVLSIKVFETFVAPESKPSKRPRKSSGDGEPDPATTFNRVEFWRHSLAVAIAAELIAREHGKPHDLQPDEAFVCGLLHDIGKLALDHVLPMAFARVISLCDLNQANIAEVERRVVGIDHHTAGKRLSEQWGLPHPIQDCIWLHGSAYETLPRLEHRRLIGLISLADLVARRNHIGYSGNYSFRTSEARLAEAIDVDPACLDRVVPRLHEELERRGRAMGLHDEPSTQLFLQSIQRANEQLGLLNAALDRRSTVAATQARTLDAISAFHAQATPGRSVQDVLDQVVCSAIGTLGQGFYAMLMQTPQAFDDATVSVSDASRDPMSDWFICQYDDEARPRNTQLFTPPPHSPSLSSIDASDPTSLNVMGILPWVADYLLDAEDLRRIRLLPLSSGWGTAAVLLHDRQALPPWAQLSALTATWGAAIAAALQHDGARRLGEELADANRMLAETQDRLLQAESLARLGEMAAGAAHEMNNPLAVISGRSQLLAMSLQSNTKEQQAAQTIFEQAHRLSDLITALRIIADPPKAQRRAVDLQSVINDAIKKAQAQFSKPDKLKPVYFKVKDHLPTVNIDPEMVSGAVTELVSNALASSPRRMTQVIARHNADEQRLVIQVIDDGVGMDDYTLSHAMDPFFSAKAAGRQMGMGLPRAKQWAAAHGGELALRSTPDVGTVATLAIPLTPPEPDAADSATPIRKRGRKASLPQSASV